MIRPCCATLLASVMLSGPAHAGQIQLSDFSQQHVEVSLAALPEGIGSVPSITADGITFESGAGALHAYPTFPPFPAGPAVQVCAERGCVMSNLELDVVSVDLPMPVAKVGALLGIPNAATAARAEFYSNADLLGTVEILAAPFEGVFAGWDAGGNTITRVRFVDTTSQGFVLALSRFTYEYAAAVPEPPAAALWLLGAAGLWRLRSRSPLRQRRKRA